MTRLPSRGVLIVFLLASTASACAQDPDAEASTPDGAAAAFVEPTAEPVSALLAEGIRQYRAGDHAAAMATLERAALDTPDEPDVYRWMGLVSIASGENREAYYWINKMGMPGGTADLSRARYLMGLRYWQKGDVREAGYWLNQAGRTEESPVYTAARDAMRAIAASEPAPALEQWPALAGLRGAAVGTDEGRAPAAAAEPSATPAAAAPAAAPALQGTWRYTRWTSDGREMVNGDVTYWLTLRGNGKWLLSNTTRSSPNTSESIAWGTYTANGGRLVLTQTGTNGGTYGSYTVQPAGSGGLTLTATDSRDVIVLARGRD